MSNQLSGALGALRTVRKREALAKGWGEPPDMVFISTTGTPIDRGGFYNRVWLKALASAGLSHHRIHDLRHTYASLLIQQGNPWPMYEIS